MKQQVYAFAKIDNAVARSKVYQEIKDGKSRFGMWNQEESLRENWYGQNAFLLKIKKDDWIVHVNMPSYGKCVAVKVISDYGFDDGIDCEWGKDFNNYLEINKTSIIEFNRNNINVLPSVNLAPRRRGQRVLQVEDFLSSIENLQNKTYNNLNTEDRVIIHLQKKVNSILPNIVSEIHRMNKSKEFERFLHRIFEKMPNTISIKNGFGWKSDNGADLIVEFENPVIGINVSTKLIVQAKSYEGSHFDKNAIYQIVTGIKEYDGDAGLLITTANESEVLEEYVREKSEEIQKTIDVIAGTDVAKFVLRYAPELLIGEY
jgi:restriction endonuclease Mrr